jgi:hypothetical protein
MLFSLPGKLFGAFYPQDAMPSVRAYLEKASLQAPTPARMPSMPAEGFDVSPLEILIQPGSPASVLTGSEHCHAPDEEEWNIWSAVARRASEQFREWGIPAFFTLDRDRLYAEAANRTVTALHCHQLSSAGLMMNAGEGTIGQIVLQVGEPSSTYAHELAHTTSKHPQDITSAWQGYNLAYFEPGHGIDPDLMEALCERGGHPARASNLVYASACHHEQYGFEESYRGNGQGFGPLELIQSKIRLSPAGRRDTIIAEGTDYLQGWLKENYGSKVAGYFAAACCREICDLLIARAVTRLTDNRRAQMLVIKAARVLSLLAQCVLLGQPLTGLVLGIVGHGPQCLLLHRTLSSIATLLGGHPVLAMLVLGLYRGNRHAMTGMLGAIAGRQAGQLVAEMINVVLQRCSPDTPAQRAAYLEAVHHPLNGTSLLSLPLDGSAIGRTLDAVDRRLESLLGYLHLHWAYEQLYALPRGRQQQELIRETERTLGDVAQIIAEVVPHAAPDMATGSMDDYPLQEIVLHSPSEAVGRL